MKQTPEQWAGLVRRLNEGGCPVLSDHGCKISPVGLVIEKIPGTSFNSIFDLKQGGTGYALELTLRNEATHAIDVVGYQITTPWGTPMLSLLPAPRKSSVKHPHYSFPEPGPYYDGGFCVNRYFARRRSRLQPGEAIEGVLVASSEEPIPQDIPHLAGIIVMLVVFDSRQNAYSAQFQLLVSRRELIARKKVRPAMASSAPSEASAAPALAPTQTRLQDVETQVT
jgi:hypothetical protein